MQVSPTQRALAECKRRGWTAQVVEKWNPHARVRQDLFGVIDLVAIVPPAIAPAIGVPCSVSSGCIVGIQACAGSSHAARMTKVRAEPRAAEWVNAGARLLVWSFAKRGARGKRKTWTLREEAL